MRPLFYLLLFSPVFAFADASFGPAPVYTAFNAASGISGGAAAPGSYVAIRGTRSFEEISFGSPDGLTVELSAPGFTAPLSWRNPANATGRELGSVIWVGLPTNAPLGRATIKLIRNGGSFGEVPIEIVRVAPGLFTKNHLGYGPALAQTYVDFFGRFYQPSNVALTENATPDHFVSLFATGLGDAAASEVFVEIAGYPLPVTYAGGHVDSTFHDQINFLMPSTTPFGCYVPVAIRVRNVVSNWGTLSINKDRYACAHPLGLSYEDLKKLDSGGTVPIARVETFRHDQRGVRVDEYASFKVQPLDADAMFLSAGIQAPNLLCLPQDSRVFPRIEMPGFGPVVTLSGPGDKRLLLPSAFPTPVPAGSEPYFAPGVWQVTTPGNNDYLGLQQTFSLPPAISTIKLAFGLGMQVRWDPAGFTSNDIVTVEHIDNTGARASDTRCSTPGWAGQLNIQPLAGDWDNTSIRVTVSPHPAGRTQFVLPRKDGYQVRGYVTYQYVLTVPMGPQ